MSDEQPEPEPDAPADEPEASAPPDEPEPEPDTTADDVDDARAAGELAAEIADLRTILAHYVEGDLDAHLEAHLTYRRDGTPVYSPPAPAQAPGRRPATPRSKPKQTEPDYANMTDDEFDRQMSDLLSARP